MFCISTTVPGNSYRPMCLKPVDSSVRDVKALSNTLESMDFNGINLFWIEVSYPTNSLK